MYDLASLAEPLVFSLVRRKSEIIYTSYVTSGELEISTSIANKENFLVIHIKYFLAWNNIFHYLLLPWPDAWMSANKTEDFARGW